jgi:CO/xanthine dehydrogenase Mo-binding subunit
VKVTGEAIYTTDLNLPGMLVGKVKYSPYPFAKILDINIEKANKLPGVAAIITAKNVEQHPYGVVLDDELPLADKYARYAGDEVAAVAAIDDETAEEALDLIDVKYEELPYVVDPERAIEPGAPIVHPERKDIEQNIAYHIDFERGEGEAAFKQADVIVEDRFSTQAVHQAYMEPQACVAQWDPSGHRLTIWTPTQHLFTNVYYLAKSLGIAQNRIRMITPYVGGGFGGKQEMFPYHPVVSLLAREAGKPVKLVFSREEDFKSGRIRTAEIVHLRLGLKKDGTMVAKSANVIVEAGAYAGIAPIIMRSSVTRADALYRLPNILTVANLVYTNLVPRGAFRGFGDPQMHFAQESLLDIAAERLGIDPVELRLKNASRKGDTTQHGLVLRSCAYTDTLKMARKESGWTAKKRTKKDCRGVGIACQVHNSGNRAAAKKWGYFGSGSIIYIDSNGKVIITNGEVDLGQGMLTVYAQVAAEVLGVTPDDIEVMPYVDTDICPYGLGTSGSRITLLGGNAVMMAAKDAKRKLLKYATERTGVKAADLEIKEGKIYAKGSDDAIDTFQDVAHYGVLTGQSGVPITGRGEYRTPDYVVVPDDTMYGNFSPAWTFSTAVVEISVDTETGTINVLNIWHAMDVGKVINPKTAEGQMEGGAIMGMGYALTEDYVWEGGKLLNTNFTDYKIPMMQPLPKIYSLWVEKGNVTGPYGAKGIGEHSLNPIAPAIASAVYNAIGVRIKDLPLTPEKILLALKEREGK